MIRIALVDDQALVRRGIRALLAEFAAINVVLECNDGVALLNGLAVTSVDVILSDIRMPGLGGIELVAALRAAGNSTPVMLLTTFDDPALCLAASAAGAQGFLLKDAEPEQLVEAIMLLAQGKTAFAPTGTTSLAVDGGESLPPARLSPREISIVKLVAGGFSNKEIARTLHLSEGTVKNYLTDILLKLDSRDRTHAVIRAIKLKLI